MMAQGSAAPWDVMQGIGIDGRMDHLVEVAPMTLSTRIVVLSEAFKERLIELGV